MEPVSTLGKYGRGLMITVGLILLLIGVSLIVIQSSTTDSPEVSAVITGFNIPEDRTRQPENSTALVTYTVGGVKYENIELGQFEQSWNVGDTIMIRYNPADPTEIQTRTMTYLGWVVALASLPFLSIGLFTTLSIRRRAARTAAEIAEDEERTTQGKLKYKVSSIVIPMCAGLPVMAIGIIFYYLEHNSVFGMFALLMGAIAVVVGLRAVAYFALIKYKESRERKHSTLPEKIEDIPDDEEDE